MIKLSVALVMLFALQCVSANQESMPGRNAGETLQKFGERIIPKGNKLAHSVVVGDFGPGRENVVRLRRCG
jgi:hypothetical protein